MENLQNQAEIHNTMNSSTHGESLSFGKEPLGNSAISSSNKLLLHHNKQWQVQGKCLSYSYLLTAKSTTRMK